MRLAVELINLLISLSGPKGKGLWMLYVSGVFLEKSYQLPILIGLLLMLRSVARSIHWHDLDLLPQK